MAEHPSVITLTGVVKTFEGGARALNGLTLAVPRGSIFGFVGMNGAGKSTTIRLLAGLERQDEGTVEVLGSPALPRPPAVTGRIGYVLDTPFYFDWLSARAYCTWVGMMEGLSDRESAQRTHELLALLDLPADDRQTIGTFSTGMKKKVSMAAALIHAPELLILDEPLEAVDAVSARTIKTILRDLTGRGSTVFITSHVLDALERFCTHVAIIHQGRLLLQEPLGALPHAVRRMTGSDPGATLEEMFFALVAPRTTDTGLTYV